MNTFSSAKLSQPLRFLRAAFFLIGFAALAPAIFAQGIVSSAMSGLVRSPSGQPVIGATVTATHVPTGTAYNSITRADGRFSFSGMVVGGPYTVSVTATGYKAVQRTDIATQLGASIDV